MASRAQSVWLSAGEGLKRPRTRALADGPCSRAPKRRPRQLRAKRPHEPSAIKGSHGRNQTGLDPMTK
jgi:hypothetical protein